MLSMKDIKDVNDIAEDTSEIILGRLVVVENALKKTQQLSKESVSRIDGFVACVRFIQRAC